MAEKDLTLRGTFDLADNALMAPSELIFNYESSNRTRAWEIERAYLWPVTPREATGSGDGQLLMQASLLTDTATYTQFSQIGDLTDNRQVAWWNQAYQVRDAGTDFIHPRTNAPEDFECILDPDTLVTTQLHICAAVTSDNATSPVRTWGYLIILKARKISAWESVFQQVKGMGQNLDN